MRMSGSGYDKSCFSSRVPRDLVIYQLRRKLALFVEDSQFDHTLESILVNQSEWWKSLMAFASSRLHL